MNKCNLSLSGKGILKQYTTVDSNFNHKTKKINGKMNYTVLITLIIWISLSILLSELVHMDIGF